MQLLGLKFFRKLFAYMRSGKMTANIGENMRNIGNIIKSGNIKSMVGNVKIIVQIFLALSLMALY